MSRVIRIDGAAVLPAEADVAEAEPCVYSVLLNGTSYEARVSGSEITVNGHLFHFEIDDLRQWNRSAGGASIQGRAMIVAPMPGKVVRILAYPGDPVVAGQGIMVVEAMKMQNELKSPRDGTVTSIQVKENDSVNAGTVLAVIE